MTKYLFLLILILSIACSQDNGCVERITVPDNVIKTDADYSFKPSYWVDLPCDYDTTELLDVSDVVQNFSYKVISYNYTSDTGNNTSKLQFEVQLKNDNNFEIEGLPIFIMRKDGVESSVSYTANNTNCNTISANETCTFSYEKETSLETEKIKSLELVSVKFLLLK